MSTLNPISQVKLYTENFVDLNILANSDVSSEQTAFPVTNAYNLERRSKVWRSNGYFNIVSGDNTIVFNEGGADFTATITAGEYSSTAAFMAAVDSAFTTAPGAAGSYTVTQNSNLKFVITKSAGTFNIKWTHADSADMAGILGYDTAVDDTGSLSYIGDILRINTSEFILWDMGLATNPEAFFMLDQRNKPIRLSPNGVFKLQGNETNNFTTPSYETTLTYDDQAIAVISEDGLHTEGLRYWRVLFMDQNPLGYVQIGAFFLGNAFQPIRGRVQFPFQSSYIDPSETQKSDGGQSFSDVFEQSQSYSAKWLGLKKEDQENITDLFRQYGTSFPFIVSFDSVSAFSSSLNRMVKFVKFSNEPTYEIISPNNFTCDMQFEEQL